MSIKVILVEDEINIRKILSKVINRTPGFEVVGECDNINDAIAIFKETAPEVVFMDIEINGSNGIDCAKMISDLQPNTKIIFATAHSEYMSNAFELYAFDYLIKPFNIERIELTLERIKSISGEGKNTDHESIDKIIKYECGLDKLIVKGKESISFIDAKEIILIQRENNTTIIYTKQDSYKTSAGLGDIESKLDVNQFMRAHKSYIINISQIKRIEPYGRWTFVVMFKDCDVTALMTKEKYEEIKRKFL